MSANRYYGLGHRKEAIAKVHLVGGTGKFSLKTGNVENRRERNLEEYFCNKFLISDFSYPLILTGNKDKFDVAIHVSGGGLVAQAGAIKLAIARALLEVDASMKPILKTYKLLTKDNRFKERKKIGKRGARRSPQFTKR